MRNKRHSFILILKLNNRRVEEPASNGNFSRTCCIDSSLRGRKKNFLSLKPSEWCMRWDVSWTLKNLQQDFIHPDCLECVWKRARHLCISAFCRSFPRSALNILVALTGGGTDELLISASPLLPENKLSVAVIWAQGPSCTGFTIRQLLFIYLFFLSLDKTEGNKTEFILLSLEEVINAKR